MLAVRMMRPPAQMLLCLPAMLACQAAWGAPAAKRSGETDPAPARTVDARDHRNDYTGLIGAHSFYSSPAGHGSVQDYVRRAKAHGHHFIVFTEDLNRMDGGKWDRLSRDCKAASGASFLAMPGLDYTDTGGSRWICFNLPGWPPAIGDPAKDSIQVNEEAGSDEAGRPSIFLVKAGRHPRPRPGCTGMELVFYGHGGQGLSRTPERHISEYLEAQTPVHARIPIVGHLLYSPEEVEQAGGFKTHVLARSAGEIPLSLRRLPDEIGRTYVSSGPRILHFGINNGRTGAREEEWNLPIEVQDDVPVTDVVVYNQKREFYHFRPGQKRFARTVRGYHQQQRLLTMAVTDAHGRMAYSSTACAPALDAQHADTPADPGAGVRSDDPHDSSTIPGKPRYSIQLTRGDVLHSSPPLLEASGHTVAGRINPAAFPARLEFQVHGINQNWDAGLYDRKTGILRRIGVIGRTGRFTVDPGKGLDFVAGNLFVADHPEVGLHLFVSGHIVQLELHNPTSRRVLVKAHGNSQIPWLATVRMVALFLAPGETQVLTLPMRAPRWSHDGLSLR